MRSHKKTYSNKCGFTLTEVLVALGIIAVLIGILIPALSVVQDMALKTKQTMQFTGIELALEAFASNSGYNDYPPSNENFYDEFSPDIPYSGAQKLAEAIVGMDGYGWHPDSAFYTDGRRNSNLTGGSLYYPEDFPEDYPTSADVTDNLKLRNKPYLDLEKANAVPLRDIYDNAYPDIDDNFVLTDCYGTVTSRNSGKKIGMPILYYRAKKGGIYHEGINYEFTGTGDEKDDHPDYYYEYCDNVLILELGHPEYGTHPMYIQTDMFGPLWFYDKTTNPNLTDPPRPYNSQSFILQSAGPDGLYGNSDDVFNFGMSN